AGDPRDDALLPGKATGVLDGFLVRHLLHAVDEGQVERAGDEAGTEPLDLVRRGGQRLAGERLGDHGAGGGLDGDGLDRLAPGLLDVARYAGDGAAGAHAGDQDVDRAVGVVPDLGASGRFVDRGIGRVLELLQQHVPGGVGRDDLLGLR